MNSAPRMPDLASAYFQANPVRKLHIGAGANLLPGWLNVDLEPAGPETMRMDATATFPFPDGVFDYVYSEHMIEHIPYPAGIHMLHECHRVLRPGGRLRVCTPNLGNLLSLYRPERTELQNTYIAWATQTFTPHADAAEPVFVINNFMRDWGHQFIYDAGALTRALRRAGFRQITPRRLVESDDPSLCGLENAQRMPPGFLDLESMTFDAVKAVADAPVEDEVAERQRLEQELAAFAAEPCWSGSIVTSADYQDLAERYRQIVDSTSWKMTYPLRRMLSARPGLAAFLRRVATLLWWTITLQLGAKLREAARIRAASRRSDS
jgi:predicted SAM-dependent methyltransferase